MNYVMNKMSVSVVIPTYNASPFIAETISSVFEQTQLPCEIIVVDDASTDRTVQIVRELSYRSPVPLKLIALPKNSGGPAVPQNTGVAEASGNLIATLDQDDLFDRLKVQRISQAWSQLPNIDILVHDATFFDSQGIFATSAPSFAKYHKSFNVALGYGLSTAPEQDLRTILANENLAGCSSMVFRKDVFVAVNGYDPKIRSACDYEFLLKATRNRLLAVLPETLAKCRKHSGNLSAAASSYNDLENVSVRLQALRAAKYKEERRALRFQIYQHLLHVAHGCSSRGQYWSAISYYVQAAKYGNSFRAARRACKTMLRAALVKLGMLNIKAD